MKIKIVILIEQLKSLEGSKTLVVKREYRRDVLPMHFELCEGAAD